MHDRDLQSVLRCGQCNKPFDKQASLKRHGYYCRSRRAISTPRLRSCTACAKGKARCDNRQPACSKCVAKAVECHYPVTTSKGTASRTEQSNSVPIGQQQTAFSLVVDSSSIVNLQEASNDSNALVLPDLGTEMFGGDDLDWVNPGLDFDFLNSPISGEAVQYPSWKVSPMVHHSAPSNSQIFQMQQAIISPRLSIPSSLSYTPRSLVLRPNLKTGPQRIANLILHTLKSYPLMMLRHRTLPPFVHPQLISSGVEDINMEPLINCISLMHMISSGIQGSRKLFWKNVRQECERICESYLTFNKWELLAAMHALSIYVLVRLDEGEKDYNNFDILLLRSVVVISSQITRSDVINGVQSTLYQSDLQKRWKDWMFEESRARIALIYRVVNMLVFFEPVARCTLQPDLAIAPLPSKKQLWEASDEFSWSAEMESEPGTHAVFALAANGEIVEIEGGQLYCADSVLQYKSLVSGSSSESTAQWVEWCAGMDGLGSLVMLAASLLV